MRNLVLLRMTICLLSGLGFKTGVSISVASGKDNPTLTSEISGVALFYQPLVCVGGNPPTEAQNQALWAVIEKMIKRTEGTDLPDLEEFVAIYPNSPWTPSLSANLGRYDYEHGLYSRALQHWQSAWDATGKETDGPGRRVADFTFAYWTRLLASLGRMDTLKDLFRQVGDRTLDPKPLQQVLNETKEGYRMMCTDPGVCFKCGTYALMNVGRVLKGSTFSIRAIDKVPSPVTGFTMAKLVELANASGLDLIPMKWDTSGTLVVPSIIHWKEDHYAAILEKHEEMYLVVDPTFDKPRWLLAQNIMREASGDFLVPKDKSPSGWRTLSQAETERITGRGTAGFITDINDTCPNGSGGGSPAGTSSSGSSNGSTASSSAGSGGVGLSTASPGFCLASCGGRGGPGGGGGAGGGAGSACCDGGDGQGGSGDSTSSNPGNTAHLNSVPGRGMPFWAVSEPYINVWVYDEPLGYQPGLGYRLSMKLAYKQRETRTFATNVFSFGSMWDSPWIAYVENTDQNYGITADMIVGGGGIRTYGEVGYGGTTEFFSQTRLLGYPQGTGGVTNYVQNYPNGAKDVYGFIPSMVQIDMHPVAFLTAKVDPYGHSTQFVYQETNSTVKLLYVIDGDGRTNTVSYTNASFPMRITGVTDPFGRSAVFQYDNTGLLTNSIDVAGLASSFTYDGQDWITSLQTPYGVTTFQNYTNSTSTNEFGLNAATNYNPFLPIRAVKIIDPAGGTNIYMLRQDCSIAYTNPADFYNNTNNYIPFLPSQYASSLLPTNVPTSTIDTTTDCLLYYRDTFYWGPRQAAGLPVDFTTFAPTNYYRGRMRHWLHNGVSGNAGISQILDMEQDPSPNGSSPGQTTWYDYDGKTDYRYIGTSSLPSLVARAIPDGSTWYTWLRRDQSGHATNIVETYSTGYGAWPLTRTNIYIYDANMVNVVQSIGPAGETLAGYAYDSNNQLLRVTNAVGDIRYYTYDSQGRMTSDKTEAGLTHTNIYFPTGPYTNWVQTGIDLEINRTNSFTYTNDLVYTLTDERGLTTTFGYDNLQRITTRSDSRGSISYTYNKLDLVKTVDRMGFTNSFGYDALRRMTASTNALGYYTFYNYCSCGALDSIRDAAGNFTYFYYDNLGQLTNTIYADNFTVSRQYNLLGQLTNVSDSAGLRITNWFNNQGLQYAVSNAYGQANALAFDLEDRTTNSIDANGVSVVMTYDNLGRMLTRSYPDGGIEKYGYTAAGLTAYTNQLGFTNFYAYDPARRKTFETNANWELTQFQYSPAGDLTNLVDGKSQSTKWSYDQYGRVTNKVDAANNTLFLYGYDANDRLTNRWTPTKGTTVYRYNPVGNLTNVVYPVKTALVLGYDSLNRLTNMVDGVGTTLYSYDAVGQLLNEDGPWVDDTVNYTYTNRLRARLSLQVPNASPWTETYGYDGIKRFSTIASPPGAFKYSYVSGSPSTLVSQLALPNGAYITNSYDNVARMLSTALKNTTNGVLNSHQYGYNVASQRTALTNTAGDYRNFSYDPIGQLTNVFGREANYAARLNEYQAYSYDAAHNVKSHYIFNITENFGLNALNELTNEWRSGSNFEVAGTTTSPATNVLLTVNGGIPYSLTPYNDNTWAVGASLLDGTNTFTAVARDNLGRSDTNTSSFYLPVTNTFSYDLNGNLLSDGNRNFSYDDENQLISVWVTNNWKSDFVYDGRMRRRIRFESNWNGSAWVTNTLVQYVYDGNVVIQERRFDPQLSTIIPQQNVTYTRGRDFSGSLQGAGGIGGLLARTDSALINVGSPFAHSFYHTDGNGNISALIYPNQNFAAKYLYDSFGNILSKAGALADANLYRFSSKELHTPSSLVYYPYRYYDATIQRWLNRDPFAENGGINLYGYVENRPPNAIDPWGWSDENRPPGSVTGPNPGFPNPNPLLPGGRVPPGYNPSWPTGVDPHGPYVQDPTSGRKFYPDPNRPGHWPHYDWTDPNGKQGHYPQKCKKPWPGQKKPPYGDQSPTDPWSPPPTPPPPTLPTTSPVIITPGVPGLPTYPTVFPVGEPVVLDPILGIP